MRALLLFFISAALLGVAERALALTQQDGVHCDGGPGITLDQVISGCGAIIDSRRLNRELTASARIKRGVAYLAKGQYDRAIQDFDEAIRLIPNFAMAYNNRGLAYERKRQYGRAMDDYNQAIRLDPNMAAAFHNRGMLHVDNGQLDQAILDFDRSIMLRPDHAASYNARGVAYAKLGERDRAIRDLDIAVKLAPDSGAAINNRGQVYFELGQFERAIQDFDAALRVWPDMGRAFANRGRSYLKLGQVDRAIADLEKGFLLEPNLGDWAKSALAEARAAKAALANRATTPSSGSRRIAMVIGNSKYPYIGNLKNAENDAVKVAAALKANGYEIIGPSGSASPFLNLTKPQIETALDAFQQQAETAEAALIWYAGHGSSFKIGDQQKDNFLLPVDFRSGDAPQILAKGVSVERMKRAVIPSSRLRILIIDACRDNSVEVATRGLMRGMLPEARNKDMIVMFSTQPGAQAADGDGDLSPFAEGFLEELSVNPRAFVLNFLTAVTGRVRAKTDPDQVPEIFTNVADPSLTLVK